MMWQPPYSDGNAPAWPVLAALLLSLLGAGVITLFTR